MLRGPILRVAVPGLVQPEWIKPGAAVVSVGTTFYPESLSLQSDLAGLEDSLDAYRHASLVAGSVTDVTDRR